MRALVVFAAALALAGCALRPRYTQFVGVESPAPVKLQLVEKKTGMPVAGAVIEVGEARGRLSFRTDAEGCFVLPVDKRLIFEDALIVVNPPPGVGRTEVLVVPVGPPEPVVMPPPVPLAAPAIEAADAGS
ncbi:MAG: hypothetical protein H6Q89_3205 [Myxococcaceae bacterium]|nr:hypothetical protein [Myxococcaceae bacterium]